MVGVIADGDMDRIQAHGGHIIRTEFTYSDSVATLKPLFDEAASRGIRVQPLAGWNNGIQVPDLSNLVNWAAAFGPGGTNWPGGSTPLPMLAIELGNENAFSYKSGSANTTGYNSIANSYGTRARALQVALAASSSAAARAVGTLIEMDDGNMGSSSWIDNVKIGGGQALLDTMIAPVAHPYGPSYMTRVNRLAGYLATAGSTKKFYLTEYGISSDNGASLTDNYGWPVNLTYDQAGTDMSGVISTMQSSGKIAQLLIYHMSDHASHLSTNDREKFFGIVKIDGTDKGTFTTVCSNAFTAG